MKKEILYPILAGVAALGFIGVGLYKVLQGDEGGLAVAGIGVAILAPGVTPTKATK